MNFYQCWKAKFESALFSRVQSDEIIVVKARQKIEKKSLFSGLLQDHNILANQCPNNFRPTVVPQVDFHPAVLLLVGVLQGDSPLLQLLRYRIWPLDLEITLSIR
jgi:hypothetical protein